MSTIILGFRGFITDELLENLRAMGFEIRAVIEETYSPPSPVGENPVVLIINGRGLAVSSEQIKQTLLAKTLVIVSQKGYQELVLRREGEYLHAVLHLKDGEVFNYYTLPISKLWRWVEYSWFAGQSVAHIINFLALLAQHETLDDNILIIRNINYEEASQLMNWDWQKYLNDNV